MEKESKDILKKVARTVMAKETILKVSLLPASRLHRLLQKLYLAPKSKKLILRPLSFANMMRISELSIDIELTDLSFTTLQRIMINHGADIAEILAIAANSRKSPPTEDEIQFFLDNLTKEERMQLLDYVVQEHDLTSFAKSIILIKGINVLEMKDASATSASKVSPMDQEEIIAPGVLSAAL